MCTITVFIFNVNKLALLLWGNIPELLEMESDTGLKCHSASKCHLIQLKDSVGLGGRSIGLPAQLAWSLGLDSKHHTHLTWQHITEMLALGGDKMRSSGFKASLSDRRHFMKKKKKKRTIINDGCDIWKFTVTYSFLCLFVFSVSCSFCSSVYVRKHSQYSSPTCILSSFCTERKFNSFGISCSSWVK